MKKTIHKLITVFLLTFTAISCTSYFCSKNGHNYDEWTITKAPTCTEPGKKERKCLSCHEIDYDTVPPLGHSYNTVKVLLEPTDTTDGFVELICELCGHKETVIAQNTGSIYIIFDTNGGTPVENAEVPKNTEIDIVVYEYDGNTTNISGSNISGSNKDPITRQNPENGSKVFAGWYLDKSCTQQVPRYKFTLEKSTVFYAKWAEPCKITLDANGGTLQTDSIIFPQGNEIYYYWNTNGTNHTKKVNIFVDNKLNIYYQSLPTPAKEGKQFAGWYTTDTFEYDTRYPNYFTANQPKTLHAKWVDPCVINFETNCSTKIPPVTVPSGMQLYFCKNGDYAYELRLDGNNTLFRTTNTNETYPLVDGKTLTGWYTDESLTTFAGDAQNKFTTTANGTITLYAKWK